MIDRIDEDDPTAAVLRRSAFGLAADLAEIRRFDHAWGKAFASGVGGERRAIEAEVLARLEAGQGAAAKLIREAVADALEGRRPRW
jgi:hypothetical protein